MDLSNKLSCETRSVSCHLSPHRFFQSEVLRLYLPALEPWVMWSVSLPSCSSWFIHMQMWRHLVHQPPPRPDCEPSPCLPWYPATALPWVLSARLPISAPPTGLDECFFFNFLVVRLPYSLIFCQSLLFFVLNCCCPSFGCARKQSVSTYASILAGSQNVLY